MHAQAERNAMTIELIVIGKTDSKEIAALVELYARRVNHYCRFAVTALPDVRNTKSLTVNFVMENMNLSKSFTIITDNPDPICRFIVEDLNRSASTYRAEGIYTHQDHTVIMTTMGRQQGSRLQRVIREADPHAFVVITNTSQVIGKGFRGGN